MISAVAAYNTANTARSKTPIYVVKINQHPVMLMSAWTLSEASGQRADYTGRNDLTPNNSPTTSTGKVNSTCVHLTAASSQYLNRLVYESGNLILNDESFMVAAWAYLDSKGAVRYICSHWANDVATNQSWGLRYRNTTDRFEFFIGYTDGTSTVVAANTLGSPSTGTWYLVIGWFDRFANTINIQVNNGTVDSAATATTALQGSLTDFRVGAINVSGITDYWDGRIDDLSLWRRILTSAERTTLYNGGTGNLFTTITDPNPVTYATAPNSARDNIGSYLFEPGIIEYETAVDRGETGPISRCSFALKDTGNVISSLVATGLIGYKVRIYAGFYTIPFSSFVQIYGGRITEVQRGGSGRYYFTCRSFLTYAQDKLIFDDASTTLQVAVNSSDTTFTVADASSFPNAQSTPQVFRRMILIENNELCDYRGRTKLSSGLWNLTSVVRSGATGFPFPPLFGGPVSHAQNSVVRYLPRMGSHVTETNQASQSWMHPMRYLPDVLNNVGNAGLGDFVIPLDSSFSAAEIALGRALQMRYVFGDAVNGKSAIEQLCRDIGCYLVERADGRLGVKLIPLAPHLHAAWKLEESSGERVDVMHVNRSRNYNLTASGSPGSTTGKIGSAVQLTAASSQYLWRTYNGIQPGAEDFCAAAWVYLDSKGAARTICGQWDSATAADQAWVLWYDNGTDRFIFSIKDSAGTIVQLQATTFGSPSTGTWYLIIASWDGDSYVMSISVNNGTADTTAGVRPVPTNEEFRVGAMGNGGGTVNYWDGRIDELGLWFNHILTASESSWLYNSGNGRAIEDFPANFPSSSPSSVDTVDDSYAMDRPRWVRNGEQAFNHVIVHYDHIPVTDKYSSTFDYRNDALIAASGKDIPFEIFSKGIRSRFFVSSTFCWYDTAERFLMDLCERYIQRFGREAPFISSQIRYTKHLIESMNDVTATFDQVVDLTTGGRTLTNASVEISKWRLDFSTHQIEMEFAKLP